MFPNIPISIVYMYMYMHMTFLQSFLSCFIPRTKTLVAIKKTTDIFFWTCGKGGLLACSPAWVGWQMPIWGGVSLLPPPLPRTPSTRPPQNEYRDILVLHVYCCFWSLGSETLLVEADARLPRNRGKKGRDIFSTAASGTKSEKWKNKGVHGLGVMKQGVDQICKD